RRRRLALEPDRDGPAPKPLGIQVVDRCADGLTSLDRLGDLAEQVDLLDPVAPVSRCRAARRWEVVAALPDSQGMAADARELGDSGDRVVGSNLALHSRGTPHLFGPGPRVCDDPTRDQVVPGRGAPTGPRLRGGVPHAFIMCEVGPGSPEKRKS